ncbi:ribonuclease inhibitor [Massilia forsythiae]|uniref:Ribonuclease inhibitor n=1 Tax=Massilia forsythiae TaxID=2728020 RepID=A0A7Z2W0S5_9BURK|nr:barstar family protein [Massilia forsythiae]QJE02811.1 ribonuclease inhibitor [Massilia forsythiae]
MSDPSTSSAGAPVHTLAIDGAAIHGIASFYDEINRVFMAGEDWTLGPSLDALDDMLYGGYGALRGRAPALVLWHGMDRARAALGVAATRAYYLDKLAQPQSFKPEPVRAALARLAQGGPTYFDLVLQVFAGHPNIVLRAAPGQEHGGPPA